MVYFVKRYWKAGFKMNEQNYIKERIATLKSEISAYRAMQDYHIFTIVCLKYFFFSDGVTLDPDLAVDFLTDGANDGGTDAIFNDPNSEGNDMIIVQSKYYESAPLTGQDIVGELYKITETIKLIDNFKVSNLNARLYLPIVMPKVKWRIQVLFE